MWKFVKDIFQSIIINYICAIMFSLSGFAPQAISNKLKYILGDNIAMIDTPNMYLAIRVISFAICAAFLLYAIKLTIKKEKENNKLSDYNGQTNITSHNQSGGITAHTVNAGLIQRKLSDSLKSTIKNRIEKLNRQSNKINIFTQINDEEAKNLAFEIKDFLIKSNFKYCGITACSVDGGDGNIVHYLSEDGNDQIWIGSNIKTDRPLTVLPYGIFMGL